MKIRLLIAGIAIASVSAHRLDEYLQATMISIEKDHVQAVMRLVPGVAVFPAFLASIDTNQDGKIDENEQRAYAGHVLRDVSLTIDGKFLKLRLISAEFPRIDEIKDGMGQIQIQFSADIPPGSGTRRLIFENHHQSQIAAYLVNCLVPTDRDIRVVAQNRNEQQSFYQLDYVQAGATSETLPVRWWKGAGWLGIAALLLLTRFVFLWRHRRRVSSIGS